MTHKKKLKKKIRQVEDDLLIDPALGEIVAEGIAELFEEDDNLAGSDESDDSDDFGGGDFGGGGADSDF